MQHVVDVAKRKKVTYEDVFLKLTNLGQDYEAIASDLIDSVLPQQNYSDTSNVIEKFERITRDLKKKVGILSAKRRKNGKFANSKRNDTFESFTGLFSEDDHQSLEESSDPDSQGLLTSITLLIFFIFYKILFCFTSKTIKQLSICQTSFQQISNS